MKTPGDILEEKGRLISFLLYEVKYDKLESPYFNRLIVERLTKNDMFC